MTAYLKLNNFIQCANQAFHSGQPKKALIADERGTCIRLGNSCSSSPSAIEQNKRTWKIFRESLMGTIGTEKFDWICHRYRSQLNFTRKEQSGNPLLPKHVELFSIGSSQLLSRHVKVHFPSKLRDLTREQLGEKMRTVQPFPIVGNYLDPMTFPGAPTTLAASFFHDKILMDKEKQMIFSDVQRLSFPAWLERMAKVTANRELLEKQIVPAPGRDRSIDYYQVYRKIATGDGLVAYALRPLASNSTLKPLIVFRPSQWAFSNEDAFETYFNDVQSHIGELGWNGARSHFASLMEDTKFKHGGEKITIAGYSLGGAHAQRFLEDHFESVSQAIFYSDPGIDSEAAERIAKKVNAMPRRNTPLNIQIFRMRGDIVHSAGDKHAGCGIDHPDVNIQLAEVDHENKKVSVMRLHSHRLFDNNAFPYRMQCYENTEELFDQLDNSKRGLEIQWYETTRRFWGTIAYYSLYTLSELIHLVSWIFGVKILRSSRDPDF